ncbi:ArsR/SmtB family transcription factor [Halorarum halobium]|uniref:ArsR/SmtB family transcription factor n=1 Tax=Halorarum halobium TaxID=3075121 RepID=UPI0028A608A3|nr:helix-turn-helix domain-containing protein [Halobaculum sp. XH14]
MPTSEGDEPALASTFDLLSDETRLRIVRELAGGDSDPVPFSVLCDRLGVSDTGRFNYHLGRLRGRLVEKREGGYVLTREGDTLAGLLRTSVPA